MRPFGAFARLLFPEESVDRDSPCSSERNKSTTELGFVTMKDTGANRGMAFRISRPGSDNDDASQAGEGDTEYCKWIIKWTIYNA